MALEPCEFCCSVGGNMSNDFYKQASLSVLCEVLAAISGAGPVGAVNVTEIGGVAVTPETLGVHVDGELFTAGDAGVTALVRYTTSGQLGGPGNNEYGPLIALNGSGALLTSITRTGFSTDPLRAEDEPLSNGETGIVLLSQRQTNPTSDTNTTGDAQYIKTNDLGYTYVDPVLRSTPTASNPIISSATSTTVLAANAARRYMEIQNNSGANITVSLAGFTLTGIVPNNTNVGFVLIAGEKYRSPPNFCSNTAITVYHTAGGPIDSISCLEA